MKPKTLIVILIILIVAGIVIFVSQRGSTELRNPDVSEGAVTKERVTARHQFKDGKHVLVGDLELPTLCHTITTSVALEESDPVTARVAINKVAGEGMCAQVISSGQFKVEFEAPENARIEMTLDGKEAISNLIPVGPSENLDETSAGVKG